MSTMLMTKEYFEQTLTELGIPAHIITALWSACPDDDPPDVDDDNFREYVMMTRKELLNMSGDDCDECKKLAAAIITEEW